MPRSRDPLPPRLPPSGSDSERAPPPASETCCCPCPPPPGGTPPPSSPMASSIRAPASASATSTPAPSSRSCSLTSSMLSTPLPSASQLLKSAFAARPTASSKEEEGAEADVGPAPPPVGAPPSRTPAEAAAADDAIEPAWDNGEGGGGSSSFAPAPAPPWRRRSLPWLAASCCRS